MSKMIRVFPIVISGFEFKSQRYNYIFFKVNFQNHNSEYGLKKIKISLVNILNRSLYVYFF